jgi:hypothetical protein
MTYERFTLHERQEMQHPTEVRDRSGTRAGEALVTAST